MEIDAMKLLVKTVDRHTYRVNISEFRTVEELKNYVCKLRGPWIRPEAQQLLYAGRALNDKERLRTYCIDERKFLVMLPIPKRVKKCLSTFDGKGNNSLNSSSLNKRIIMQVGDWTEKEVRRALLITLNNPSRAIEYLTEKIEFFPNMITPPASNLFLSITRKEEDRAVEDRSEEEEISAVEVDQSEDYDAQAQEEIRIINEYTQNDGDDDNPINQNSSDDETDSELENMNLLDDNRVISWKKMNVTECLDIMKREKLLNNLNDLTDLGFRRELAVKAVTTCDGNVEAAANLLLEELKLGENEN